MNRRDLGKGVLATLAFGGVARAITASEVRGEEWPMEVWKVGDNAVFPVFSDDGYISARVAVFPLYRNDHGTMVYGHWEPWHGTRTAKDEVKLIERAKAAFTVALKNIKYEVRKEGGLMPKSGEIVLFVHA